MRKHPGREVERPEIYVRRCRVGNSRRIDREAATDSRYPHTRSTDLRRRSSCDVDREKIGLKTRINAVHVTRRVERYIGHRDAVTRDDGIKGSNKSCLAGQRVD